MVKSRTLFQTSIGFLCIIKCYVRGSQFQMRIVVYVERIVQKTLKASYFNSIFNSKFICTYAAFLSSSELNMYALMHCEEIKLGRDN